MSYGKHRYYQMCGIRLILRQVELYPIHYVISITRQNFYIVFSFKSFTLCTPSCYTSVSCLFYLLCVLFFLLFPVCYKLLNRFISFYQLFSWSISQIFGNNFSVPKCLSSWSDYRWACEHIFIIDRYISISYGMTLVVFFLNLSFQVKNFCYNE